MKMGMLERSFASPETNKLDDNTSIYVRNFCLKCAKADITTSSNSVGHDDCEGPVLFVSDKFDHSSALNLDRAMMKVNSQISKLQDDEAELKQIREKYKVQ